VTFWEAFGVIVSAAGLFASILGAFLTHASRKNGEATRALISSMEERMVRHLTGLEERTVRHSSGLEERMSKHFTEVLDRMDRRADERHREVVEAIRTLKAA
jgi:hypothetical protein